MLDSFYSPVNYFNSHCDQKLQIFLKVELKKEQVYTSLIKYKCATMSSKIYGHKIESFQSDDITMSTCLCVHAYKPDHV